MMDSVGTESAVASNIGMAPFLPSMSNNVDWSGRSYYNAIKVQDYPLGVGYPSKLRMVAMLDGVRVICQLTKRFEPIFQPPTGVGSRNSYQSYCRIPTVKEQKGTIRLFLIIED